LVGGDPGIGKSTLLISAAGRLAAGGRRVLYVSGEESLQQIKLRALRLGLGGAAVLMLAQTRLELIAEAIRATEPDVVILDSIQVMGSSLLQSAPGSVAQVRFCAHELVQLVKQRSCALFIVGHVTKDGALAGPKVLEHLVDTVLYFEGEAATGLRILRSTKNRFGATYELGVFQMEGDGLNEVANPSELFLSHRKDDVPGCVVAVTIEGSRPLLGEVQALTCPCGVGLPRRRTTGVDGNRLSMLLAVLERRVGLRQLAQQDVFVSCLGGMRMQEPGADLAIAIAIASSLKEAAVTRQTFAIGEVGLTGEVRAVANMQQRIYEAKRIGYTVGFVPVGAGTPERVEGMRLIAVRHVREAVMQALKSAVMVGSAERGE
jgi:DNA repair protein RadA/Sms